MSVRAQWVVVVAVVLLLGGGAFAATRLIDPAALAPVRVGARAPDFSAQTLDLEPEVRRLSDYRGQVVLLNVWATWCGPCRVEMPSIQHLHDEFAPRGFRVVAVSVDEPGQEAGIRGFVRENGLTFDILYDGTRRIERLYQLAGIPETFVIGRDGVIRKRVTGAAKWDSPANRALIAQLLEERAR